MGPIGIYLSYPKEKSTLRLKMATILNHCLFLLTLGLMVNANPMGNSGNDLAELKRDFSEADKNADGVISLKELETSLRSELLAEGVNIPQGFDFQSVFNLADSDGNGKIDFSEYLFSELSEEAIADELIFQLADADGDGFVSQIEIEQSLSNVSGKELELQAGFFQQFDTDSNGRLNVEEFKLFQQYIEDNSEQYIAQD